MDPPLCPTCGQPASEALGGPEHEWECRNEACPEFGQPVTAAELPPDRDLHATMPDDDRARRLAFAIPPVEQPPEDLVHEWLDPADEDDRSVLLAAAHPDLDTGEETVVVGGQEMNPRLHLAMHEIVAKQLADHDRAVVGHHRGSAPRTTVLSLAYPVRRACQAACMTFAMA
ncbi:MAG TPA: hypothetical protein VK631_27005 [Solirubrobacteraceae bacterium]|nr:hypothetical protein [Solirubrobacteraceae bacterium]